MSAAPIPYEKQSPELTGRSCGAACLSMAYRSFGKEVPQKEIWPRISKPNRSGRVSSTTHLMVQDALNQGFSAVAFQARYPFQVLRLCQTAGVRAILNHRVQRDSTSGHYTVLANLQQDGVFLHDPLFGPSRRVSVAELAELWLSPVPDSEISRGVLIAIGPAKPPDTPTCEFCHTPMPLSVECSRCGNPTSMRPAEVLGCARDGCIARMWNWICCPACDHVFSWQPGVDASTAQAPSPTAAAAASDPTPRLDFSKLFAAIDQFTARILSMPAAADHPEIQKQLELIAAGKEECKRAYEQQMAHRAAVLGQLAAIVENHKHAEEAQMKKIEELNAPKAPLDGNALGRALLKNLGFIT